MALTRVLFPLALLSLLIVIASAEYATYTQNQYDHVDNHPQHDQLIDHGDHEHQHHDDNDLLSSTLNLDVDLLLGNLNGNEQDDNEGKENFVPSNPSYEKNKPYQGQDNIVKTKPFYNHEQKSTFDQAHEGIDSNNINAISIQGFILCESEANKHSSLEGAEVEITCSRTYENGYNKAPYVLHPKTDEKGCFREIVAVAELKNKYINLKECKAYPKYSPSKTCNVPAAYSSSGAQLSLLRNEEGKAYYTVGNSVYTPNTHYEAPTNYPASNNLPVQNGY